MRSSAESEEMKEKEKEWCDTLDKNTADFVQSMENRRISKDLATESEELLAEREIRKEEAGLVEDMISVKEGVFACKECDKYFNGRDYVIKHIRQNHNNKVEGVTLPVGVEKGT